jgi:hypothetical protein
MSLEFWLTFLEAGEYKSIDRSLYKEAPLEMCENDETQLFLGGGNNRAWTQGLAFARQALYHLSHISTFFCFSYFSYRVLFFI